MKLKENIFENNKNIDTEKIILHLKRFNKHHIKLNIPNTFKLDKIFYTKHLYENQLVIRLKWFTQANSVFESTHCNMNSLMFLKEKGFIKIRGHEILNYKSEEKKGSLTEKQYKELEYNLKDNLFIKEHEFTELKKQIDNYIEFEKYYKNKKKDGLT